MVKKCFYSFLFLGLLFSCKDKEVKEVSQKVTSVKSYTYNELKPLLEKNDGKTYVVNFWATWCAPCVKELPAFEKLNQEYAAKNVEVILVSLDFPKQIDKRLIPFINKNNLQSRVVLLNDVNEDVWIKAIDTTWSGALPATLIYNAKSRKFYEESFDYEKLETELQSVL
ncbi:TlpA disulfide reductase family protein [Polaribacter staleyi]|uniref:TlpA disulfide reductase family protein n=1 Tax=Polaribacter staleyi TaxID=2022337 RepID=UPI0031BBC658